MGKRLKLLTDRLGDKNSTVATICSVTNPERAGPRHSSAALPISECWSRSNQIASVVRDVKRSTWHTVQDLQRDVPRSCRNKRDGRRSAILLWRPTAEIKTGSLRVRTGWPKLQPADPLEESLGVTAEYAGRSSSRLIFADSVVPINNESAPPKGALF